jgi:hypothetical protein
VIGNLLRSALLCALPLMLHGAANIVIINGDAAGVGFNDPTPRAPVGGNTGTTLGQQRLLVFQRAAEIWGNTLDSTVTIEVRAVWTALSCNATSAVLGSAGPTYNFRDFAGAPFAATWYHAALANKLGGQDFFTTATVPPGSPTWEINANFNVNLGNTGCLTGFPFYLGLDTNHGTQVNLLAVVLHEFAHGLGFSTNTNGVTGAPSGGFQHIYNRFLFSRIHGTTWPNLDNAQRAASAVSVNGLVWSGSNVTSAAPTVLSPFIRLNQTGIAIANYQGTPAAFGAPLSTPRFGEVMPIVDLTAPGPGCNPYNAINQRAVQGKIALVDRGGCTFAEKVKRAQDAGAIGVIIGNNTAAAPIVMTGTDPTITIPSTMISQANANSLRNDLRLRSRTNSGVFINLGNDTQLIGSDPDGRVLMFAPNPFQSGSSVSHYDASAFRNLLMEPSINTDLPNALTPPLDLTFPLLRDLGW